MLLVLLWRMLAICRAYMVFNLWMLYCLNRVLKYFKSYQQLMLFLACYAMLRSSFCWYYVTSLSKFGKVLMPSTCQQQKKLKASMLIKHAYKLQCFKYIAYQIQLNWLVFPLFIIITIAYGSMLLILKPFLGRLRKNISSSLNLNCLSKHRSI